METTTAITHDLKSQGHLPGAPLGAPDLLSYSSEIGSFSQDQVCWDACEEVS